MLLAGERERCLIMSRGCVTSCLDRDVVVESALGGAECKGSRRGDNIVKKGDASPGGSRRRREWCRSLVRIALPEKSAPVGELFAEYEGAATVRASPEARSKSLRSVNCQGARTGSGLLKCKKGPNAL